MKALLDQLRVSQAWQEVTSPSTQNDETPSRSSDEQPASSSTATSTSVASLLSQLHSLPPLPPPLSRDEDSSHKAQPAPRRHEPTPPAVPVPPRVQTDTRSYTFQQALPYLAQLVEDPGFVDVIKQVCFTIEMSFQVDSLSQMKKDQDDLERQLWEDRRAIHEKYEEKVKIAVTKCVPEVYVQTYCVPSNYPQSEHDRRWQIIKARSRRI